MNYVFLTVVVIIFSVGNFSNMHIFGQSSNSVNWLELCQSPLIDLLIAEPCETLSSHGGYQLTPEGQKVWGCILVKAGGALLGIGTTGDLITGLAASVQAGNLMNCDSTASINSPNDKNQDALSNILNSLIK